MIYFYQALSQNAWISYPPFLFAEQRRFQHIVVFDLDRFSRRPEAEVLTLVKNLRLMHGVQVHACYGDEWKDAVESINNIPNMGIIGEALSEFLEKIFLGMQARASRLESERISRRILESDKFQKAKKRKKNKKIGRPKIPDDVVILIKALLEYNVPYLGIQSQVEYKNCKGEIKTPSEAFVSLIKKDRLKKK